MTSLKYSLFLYIIIVLTGCTGTEKHCNDKEITPPHPKLNPDFYNVAFLIMDGVYNTELTAPYDVFQHTIFRDSIRPMNVFTVAKTTSYITSFEGLKIIPDFNYQADSLPRIDILVVPSAEHHLDTDLEDTTMINFVKQVSEEALYLTSHCDGAFILAKANLLSHTVCTTFPGDIHLMRTMFPTLDIRDSVLFVHDGKFITSAGGSRSFEASLYLCELLYGKAVTKQIAEGLVMDWPLKNYPHLVIDR